MSGRYRLDEQVGFVLRQAQQRHTALFSSLMIEGLTPTQWAAMAKLAEVGACSQNLLGRHTAMDAATIKGVIDRLTVRGLTRAVADADDARRRLIDLTPLGVNLYTRAAPIAHEITARTLAPLNEREQRLLAALLRRMA
ncbi:MAG TPA: MarR family winged helix-turn-helix transcriptional regulator [Roseiarcus sp.]|nr:MarR family winged helix-turn-helix transcriptional regulator [Roseiarcus sp.]